MKLHCVALLALLVTQALAQAAPAQSAAPAPAQSATAAAANAVAPDAAVITVEGVCKVPAAKTGACKTEISRSEFERLMAILSRQRNGQAQASIPPDAKRQLAVQYSRLLLFAHLAEEQGLQNTPEGKELIHFLRLQAMTEELARSLQQKATLTPDEIRNYYEQHRDQFTQWNLQRVVVPLRPKAGDQANKQELKKLAEDFRQRASQGGDFDALQKEAFEKVGMKNPPQAKLVLLPGQSLPEAHSAVYQLKPGELSPVIEDPSGFFIYKLDSSSLVPLGENDADIHELLSGQKAQEAIRKIVESNKITLDPSYFELAQQNAAPKTSSAQPMGARR